MIQSTTPAPARPKNALGLRHLDHLNLSVTNLRETEDWYARVFGFEVVERAICDDGTPMSILAFEATVEREQSELNWGGEAIDYPHSTSFYVEDPTGYGIEVALWDEDQVAFEAE